MCVTITITHTPRYFNYLIKKRMMNDFISYLLNSINQLTFYVELFEEI